MSTQQFENSIVDQFLQVAALTQESESKRSQVFGAIKDILTQVLDESVTITTFGSGPLKTYLPDSDIDITIVFKHEFLKHK